MVTRMNERRRKMVIVTAAGVLLAVALVVLALGLMLPITAPVSHDASSVAASDAAPAAATPTAPDARRRAIPLDQLVAICSRDWQQPLFDSPEQIAAQQAAQRQQAMAQAPPLSAQLVGTIVEPGRSMAVFALADGSFGICGEGESIDQSGVPLTVTRVARLKVTVHYNGVEHELELPEPPSPTMEGL